MQNVVEIKINLNKSNINAIVFILMNYEIKFEPSNFALKALLSICEELFKEKLSQITGKSYETIRSSIQGLVNKNILIREERACYRVNPKYIAKGKWHDIKALRLVIDYTEKGRDIKVESITPHSITYTVKDDGYTDNVIEQDENLNQLDLFNE